MKEWLEIIRDTRFFNLLVKNTDPVDTDVAFNINTGRGIITTQYDSIFPVYNFDMPDPPNFIAVSDAQSHATKDSSQENIIPHFSEPTPAQRAGNVVFIWGRLVRGVLLPHREDGFPAVVVAVGLSKHYHYGKLDRKEQYPAIKIEHLAALWYTSHGTSGTEIYRSNGPSTISFENYKEFWVDGEFKGHRWTDFFLSWRHRILNTPEDEDTLGNFLEKLNGTTNMFSDIYFTDEEDEVCYIADFS